MALRLDDLPPSAADAAATATAWMDPWWDPDAALLWNPPGAYEDTLTMPRSAHLVRESAWYAAGLLLRGGPGDAERAARTLEAVTATQYDIPGGVADGTFRRLAGDAVPPAEPVEWVDYDPNWRQFVGTTLALVAERAADRLPERTVDAMRDAIAHAVAGDPPDRVSPAYSNIALMRAWLDGWAGAVLGDTGAAARAGDLAAATVERFDRHGTFDEYNSPTYYGIDLYALALWRAHPVTPRMRDDGARLEAALWQDVAGFYHAGLRNLCGPYDRSYGVDMARYVANLGLWIWVAEGREAAPVPDPAGELVHAHDLCKTPVLAAVGAAVPAGARRHLTTFDGERVVRRDVPGDPTRTATAWLAPTCMAGGMDSGATRTGWSQYRPATVHWRAPDGGVAWLQVLHRGFVDAWAEPGLLGVRGGPHPRRGAVDTAFEASVPGAVDGHRWRLPGLTVDVDTEAAAPAVEATDDGALRVRYPAADHDAPRQWRLRLLPD